MSNNTYASSPCILSRHTRLIWDREIRRLNRSSLSLDDVRNANMAEDQLSGAPWLTDGDRWGHVSEEFSERTFSDKYEKQEGQQARQRILVVANRLPLTATRKGDDVWHLNVSAGGLVSALLGLHEYESRWIGWAGVNVPDEIGQKALTEALARKRCIPVFLDQETVDEYYNGYCNNMLWPLFHYLRLPQEDGLIATRSFETQFNAYKKANKLFADVVMEHYQPGDIVWCHDYHLMFLPKYLKEYSSHMKVGFFLHTPFPSSEIHRMLPSRSEILRAVLAADLVGFHTYDYARHFVSACTRILGLEGTPVGVEDQGRITRVAAFPIGIDSDRFIKAVERPQVLQKMKEFRGRFSGRKLILGVDRLDMIKGIPQKILAFEKFLEENPDWRDKVVLVQIAVPTRINVPEYQKLTSLVHKTVGRINGRFGTLTGVPILHLDCTLHFDELCALYAITDVALVTSLRDGMNLVSYEFVACQASKKGVLILSEFAGAAQSLGAGAILVNPWNTTEVANSIAYALNMPPEEREKRHKFNFMHVTTHTSQEWAATYLSELNDAVVEAQLRTTQTPPPLPIKLAADRYSKSSNRLLILGFNATLTEPVYKLEKRDSQIKELDLALHPELKFPLQRLCDDPNTTVVVLSGSERNVLDNNFSGYNIWLAAENGMFLRHTKGQWMTTMPENISMSWLGSVKHVFDYFTERTPRSRFELRETSIVWNYKYADCEFGKLQARDLLQHLCTGPISNASVDVIQGGRSVEVRTVGVTKGAAMNRILGEIVHHMATEKPIDYVLCIGHFLAKDEDIYTFFEPDLPPESPPEPQANPEPNEMSVSKFSRSNSWTSSSRARYRRSLSVSEYKDGFQGSKRGWRPAGHTKKPRNEGSSVLDLRSFNYFSCAVGRMPSKSRYLLSSDGVVTLLKELANLSYAQ